MGRLLRRRASVRGHVAAAAGLLVAAVGVGACGDDGGGTSSHGRSTSAAAAAVEGEAFAGLPRGSEPVELDPAKFTTDVDNPYWPMKPGSRWVYRETDAAGGRSRVVITVTDKVKRIANGVEARVVRDVVSEDGEPVEITDDWYAQDATGNVWYLGEATAEYENGKVKTRAGSFEAGVDGALPGIIMPADPEPGMRYRQEYYKGEAEDEAAVVSVREEQVEVPFGHFTDVVMTRDLVPLEPKVQELKFYARGVGPVLSVGVSGGRSVEELLSFRSGSSG